MIANLGSGTAAGNVSVLLGNGTGFGAGTLLTLMDTKAVKPRAAVLADMNGDAKQDIVVTDENNGKVYVVFGKGDGTFDGAGAKGVSLAGVSPAGFALAVGDFNGDKFPDVVAVDGTNNRSSISVLLNDGKGALGTATGVTVGLNPRGVATGDFDQDGKTDIAVTNLSGDSLMILRGDGAGKFGTGATLGQAGPRGIWVADLNCDGKPDVVTTLDAANQISVVLNESTGAGNFTLRATTYTTGAGSGPQLVSAGDADGDGRVDITVGRVGGRSLGLFLNKLL